MLYANESAVVHANESAVVLTRWGRRRPLMAYHTIAGVALIMTKLMDYMSSQSFSPLSCYNERLDRGPTRKSCRHFKKCSVPVTMEMLGKFMLISYILPPKYGLPAKIPANQLLSFVSKKATILLSKFIFFKLSSRKIMEVILLPA